MSEAVGRKKSVKRDREAFLGEVSIIAVTEIQFVRL
jgi:hypothetical protein